MYIICADMEGIFTPEIWINVAEMTGIEELRLTTRDISEAFSKKGFEVDRRKIELEDPIHALGVYTVQIRMGHDIVAKPKVWVVKAVHREV